ncbi:MAG: hypothetical protein Q9160_003249 [Pyrenula sp. 1 TL-2023]
MFADGADIVIEQLVRRAPLSIRQSHQSSRPPTAPKQTPNIKHIRQNVELYEENCINRNYQAQAAYPKRIQTLSEQLAQIDLELKRVREARNKSSEVKKLQLGASTEKEPIEGRGKGSDDAKQLKEQFQTLKKKSDVLSEEINSLALALPNLTSPQTPTGSEPKILEYVNYDPSAPPQIALDSHKSHVDIGTHLSLLDFQSSSTSTGWGWYFLLNDAVLLEQALINHALSIGRQHGFLPVSPPSIVYSHIASACGFAPRDQNNEQQIYHLTQPSSSSPDPAPKPPRSLAATAEIPLAAMHASSELPSSRLPIKLIGPSRCYRAESGARGLDTKGLYRVHEFTKVEMFAWASPFAPASTSTAITTTDPSENGDGGDDDALPATATFNAMLQVQLSILRPLHLPLRVLEMPSTDLGASAYRKIDIECLFPSRMSKNDGWGELSSVSVCSDHQSRRLGTRVRDDGGGNGGGKGVEGGGRGRVGFAHTVNGTAVAVPRVLAAVLEWGWRDEDGGYVVVPECLRGWMGGRERIERIRI